MSMGYVTYRPELADGAAVQVMVNNNPDMYPMGTITQSLDGIAWMVSSNDGTTVVLSQLNSNPSFNYSEGSYEPELLLSASGSYNYGIDNTFAWTKTGRVCHVQGVLSVSGANSPVGNLKLTLPFVPAELPETSDESGVLFAFVGHDGNFQHTYLDIDWHEGVEAGLVDLGDDGGTSPITAAEVSTSFFILVNFSYVVGN
jgi:hypothetical protein